MITPKQIDDGGPAYPTQTYDSGAAQNGIGVTVTDKPGMTLRQWFAAHASEKDIEEHRAMVLRAREQARYAYADAMIAAGKEPTP